MSARDASGNQVSLLNEDPAPPTKQRPVFHEPLLTSHASYYPSSVAASYSSISLPSTASSPETPGLLRSDSYDSQNTAGPRTPLTPGPVLSMEQGRQQSYMAPWYGYFKDHDSQYEHRPFYSDHSGHPQHMGHMLPHGGVRRGSAYSEGYEEDSYANRTILEKGPKRYPCRFRATHGCDKTFTTSGHASRHSKIHTAEKAVACTHPGCEKKFTRADNMKQHLETHYKGKSRGWHKSAGSSHSTSEDSESSRSELYERRINGAYSAASSSGTHSMEPSPVPSHGNLDMNGFLPILPSNPPTVRRRVSSNLDLLAVAAASQTEG
jgi:uncharacterized Zn-finger protein